MRSGAGPRTRPGTASIWAQRRRTALDGNHRTGLSPRPRVSNVNADAIPWVTYTDPELAQTGITEETARNRRIKFRILRWPYHDNDRAQAERETHGHIKIVTDRKGRILGATIVGAQAGEMISLWSLAIAQGLNVRALTGVVMP